MGYGAGIQPGYGAGRGVGYGAGAPSQTGAYGAGFSAGGTPLTILGSALKGWWDFSDASTLFQNSNGTTAVAADADPIGYAQDKSGTGNHVIQATAGARPTYRTNIKNGRAVCRFDGTDDFLQKASVSYAQPNHMFVVARYISASNNSIFDGNNNEMRLYRDTSNMNIFAGAGVAVATTPESWHIYACKFSGASSDLNIDGTSNTGSAGTATAAAITFGSAVLTTVFGNVEVGEAVFVGAGTITAGQIASTIAYLNSRWAIY